MSYWISLNCPRCGESLPVEPEEWEESEFGYECYRAEMNHVWFGWPSVMELTGLTGEESVLQVEAANDRMRGERGEIVTRRMLDWIRQHPEGIWRISG